MLKTERRERRRLERFVVYMPLRVNFSSRVVTSLAPTR